MSVYRAFFAGLNTANQDQLWATNGTAQGTSELLAADSASSGLAPEGLTNFGKSILLAGTDAAGNYNLFISNGTAAGTTELTSAGTGSAGLFGFRQEGPHGSTVTAAYVPQQFTVLGPTAIFAGIDANNDIQLWSTDGTSAGTGELAVFFASSDGLDPTNITALGNVALFDGVDGLGTDGLWVTNGTAYGTVELLAQPDQVYATHITDIAGGRALFAGEDGNGNEGLWVTDGTDINTTEIATTDTPASGAGHLPSDIVAFGNGALFTAFDASGRDGLWITDGTSTGTAEILPTGASSSGLFAEYIGAINGRVFTDPVFTVLGNKVLFDGIAADGTEQLWVTDGTSAGTKLLTTAAEGHYNLDSPDANVVVGGKVLFAYIGPSGKSQLWVTDGTAAGTGPVEPAGAGPAGPQNLTALGGEAVFSAYNSGGQDELWVSNGTSTGTTQLAVPQAGASGLAPADLLTQVTGQDNIYGSLSGGSTIEGTPGDDYIHGYGLANTIYTNGGNDFINAGAGSDLVLIGGAADPDTEFDTTTVNLQGSGNTVESDLGGAAGEILASYYAFDQPVYTGTLSVVGYAGGNTVAAAEGNATIDLGGTDNTVHVGGGTSTIRMTGGDNTVTIGSNVNQFGVNDTILLGGLDNTVTNESESPSRFGIFDTSGIFSISGGGGGGTFSVAGASTALKTSGFGNVVNVGNIGTDVIAPGDGDDTVNFGDAATPFDNETATATVTLNGQYNTVTGLASALTITGGDGHGTFSLVGHSTGDGGRSVFDYGAIGFDPTYFDYTYTRSYSIATTGLYNSFLLDDTNSNTVVAGTGYDSVVLEHPVFFNEGDPPPDPATIPTQLTTVTFAGNHNALTAANGDTQVLGTGSATTLTLGNGDNTLSLAGAGNTITVGTGHNTIDAGTGTDTVHLTGGVDSVVFHGSGDMAFLGSGVNATLTDGTPNLHLDVLTGDVRAAITGFGGGGLVTLEAGTVSAVTVGGVLGLLHSDGSGGTALALAGGGVLDFKGVAPGAFSAANFLLHS